MTKPGFSILAGPDSALLKEHIATLLGEFSPASGKWVRYTFWGDEPLQNDFWEKLTLQGLFAEPRAIILRNAQNLNAEQLKKLSAALGSAVADIWPFICFELPFEKGKLKIPAVVQKLQCVSFAQKKGWFKEIAPLATNSLTAFIKKEALATGLSVTPAEVEAIAASVPPDAGAIKLELQKLSLACPDGTLTEGALAMLNYSKDIDIFAFLQGLQNAQNPGQIWKQFLKDSENSSDAGLFGFIAMLLREARQLWQILENEPVFLPSFVLPAKKKMAQRLGHAGLSRIWDYALKADKGVKAGEHTPTQAFERLIAELFSLFK